MSQYFTGITDIYYAVMTDDTDKAGQKPTYGTPKVLGRAIEFTATPSYKEGSLYASNTAVRYIKKLDYYDVTIGVDQLEGEVLADVLGRVTDSNGVQHINGEQAAPYVAIGFAVTLDDGGKELWWLYKGKFAEISKTANTESDAIEYQTPSIEARFDRRICDNEMAAICPPDKAGTMAATWFNAVYEQPSA